MEQDKIINNIINDLLLMFPLFGNILANLQFVYSKMNVPAPAFTDGKKVYYKNEFFIDFSYEEQKFIIAHEIFHIVLKHLKRNMGKDRDLLNYVEDAIINQILVRQGLTMPEGVVDVPFALSYSVDELYLIFLPKIEEIKKWLKENTFHIQFDGTNEVMEKIASENNNDLEDIINSNAELRKEFFKSIEDKISNYGNNAGNKELEAEKVGNSEPLLSWQKVLEMSISSSEKNHTLFYEVDSDGILRREESKDEDATETEIIIDTSGSMYYRIIKLILRECKNILSLGEIKVGFCDTIFYGWNSIETEEDIDNLKVVGRGGTSFEVMSNSFSGSVTNKIVMTDGLCDFPEDCGDIIWLVINWYLPKECKRKDLNVIFIDINTIYQQLYAGTIIERKRVPK